MTNLIYQDELLQRPFPVNDAGHCVITLSAAGEIPAMFFDHDAEYDVEYVSTTPAVFRYPAKKLPDLC